MNFRIPALEVLSLWESGGRFAQVLVDEVSQRQKLAPRDRAALQRLVFVFIRNDRLLEHWARSFAHGKLDPKTLRLAKMGIAGLVLLEEPPHAAVAETVALAGWAKGLLNGILRNVAREVDQLRAGLPELPPDLRWSLPRFLWERWCGQHGMEAATAYCQWNHQPAPVILRLNPLKPPPPEVLASAQLLPLAAHPDFFVLEGAVPVDWFRQGWFYAQDPSTAKAVALLEVEPGQRVLDACAAPGGKSFAIAAGTGNGARLIAADQSRGRLRRLEENLARLGVTAEVRQADWTAPGEGSEEEGFDRILLDVPCSNTGVIRRRIDVPHRLRPEDFVTLIQTQERLLRSLAPRLKPGGRLVYSTCSIDIEEGHLLVDRFVAEDRRFQKTGDGYTRPWVDEVDGTYAAVLVRSA